MISQSPAIWPIPTFVTTCEDLDYTYHDCIHFRNGHSLGFLKLLIRSMEIEAQLELAQSVIRSTHV